MMTKTRRCRPGPLLVLALAVAAAVLLPGGAVSAASTPIDHSGTVTAGGTAQALMAANASRRGCFVQNNSPGDLWFNDLTTAAPSEPSLWLPPGAAFSCNPAAPSAISIYGAVTGQSFTAREW
jgi:hypothetical protein